MRSKKILTIFLVPILLHVGCVIYFHFGENFHPRQFEHGFRKWYSTEVSGLDYSKLDTILNQPFHILGQGEQMTALESADGKYVLKLFNPRVPLKKNWYLNWKNWKRTYSVKWISHEWLQTERRLEKMFKRHQIAFSVLREETGLLFVHLTPTDRVSHYVHVIDKKDKRHILNLNQTPFVVQKKAILAAEYLDKLVQENKIVEAKEAVSQIEQLFAKRLMLGITDQNPTMHNNYGFVDAKPIQIDVGKIEVIPELLQEPSGEQKRILDTFHTWLDARFPSTL